MNNNSLPVTLNVNKRKLSSTDIDWRVRLNKKHRWKNDERLILSKRRKSKEHLSTSMHECVENKRNVKFNF